MFVKENPDIKKKEKKKMQNIFFFLPSIIDRSEEINKYLNNVSISPIDITQH